MEKLSKYNQGKSAQILADEYQEINNQINQLESRTDIPYDRKR